MNAELKEVNWPEIYAQRRNRIRPAAGGGIILWLGHVEQPRNYAANSYPFRQNSHFLYYTGLSAPDLALISYPETDYDVLFSKPLSLDDVIWSGDAPGRVEYARQAGVETVEDISRLDSYLAKAKSQGLRIHYLQPYQASSILRLSGLLACSPAEVSAGKSDVLGEAVAKQRSVKADEEIREIEYALEVSAQMYRAAAGTIRVGMREYEVAGVIQGEALKRNCEQAYIPIVTIHGEVLHNHSYNHRLEDGQLMLIDAGAESPRFYASDITRTYPVSGRFSSIQSEVYNIVLKAQLQAIGMTRAGVEYKDVHRGAAKVLAEGLASMGLIKGNLEDAVSAGAHAMFFPHGIGHMLGLDVHDMEDLGDIVGYRKGEARSEQFGLNYLRLSRKQEKGFVLTVEPGIYFIPALIDRWRQERLHREFIDYDKVEAFRSFGGIRIEDNVLVTDEGARVLGPGIPKTVADVEAAMSVSHSAF